MAAMANFYTPLNALGQSYGLTGNDAERLYGGAAMLPGGGVGLAGNFNQDTSPMTLNPSGQSPQGGLFGVFQAARGAGLFHPLGAPRIGDAGLPVGDANPGPNGVSTAGPFMQNATLNYSAAPQNSGDANPPANPPGYGAGSTGTPPTMQPARPPMTGGLMNYFGGQRAPMTGRGFDASGFGGLGMAYGGQRPGIGARYWSRLNSIGGNS